MRGVVLSLRLALRRATSLIRGRPVGAEGGSMGASTPTDFIGGAVEAGRETRPLRILTGVRKKGSLVQREALAVEAGHPGGRPLRILSGCGRRDDVGIVPYGF